MEDIPIGCSAQEDTHAYGDGDTTVDLPAGKKIALYVV